MLADCGGFAARAHTADQVYPRRYRLKEASIEKDFVNETESALPGLAVRRGFSDSERVKSKPGTPMNTAGRGHQYTARLLASAYKQLASYRCANLSSSSFSADNGSPAGTCDVPDAW
jgi:hypothetical protein